ncbi:protein-methionine-sulfoxide reductase heme-binding subunit MsrQ [Aliiglaciecola litoralis]|uniref:Protein-methionine-sulfoxide reductase heme-binding subunit MsrQ n=1 Tax=Aliiglaciecola litoralis TaxID=582857 RepID=A0ABN1LC49_9ALTE
MRLLLTPKQLLAVKVVSHIGALSPLLWIFYQAITDQLGGDPVEALLHFTGIGAFNLLLLSLLVSPLAKLLKSPALIKTRRLLGLYAFTYALSHFLSYVFFELQLEWQLLLSEIVKRPYITVGFTALLILTLLASTSTAWAQRKLGRKWQRMHNWVYLAVLLVALHYIWSVKSDVIQPLFYWAMTLILLYWRRLKLTKWIKK